MYGRGIFRSALLAIVDPGQRLIIRSSFAQTSEPVQLTPGFTRLIRFDRPIATVVIGNPEVADARAQTDRSIALVGKAVGITNLIALDNTGAEVFSSLVVVGARDAGKVIINARSSFTNTGPIAARRTTACASKTDLNISQPTAPIVVARPPRLPRQPRQTNRADRCSSANPVSPRSVRSNNRVCLAACPARQSRLRRFGQS